MDEPEKPASLPDLSRRLKAVQESRQRASQPRGGALSNRGMGAGFRIAVEMLAALVVGTGLGLVLDRWLGTAPWLLILGFFLGSGAALTNVMRTARELDAQRKRDRAESKDDARPPGSGGA